MKSSRKSEPVVVTVNGKTTVSLGVFKVVIYSVAENGRPIRYRATWWVAGAANTRTSTDLATAIETAKEVLRLRSAGREDAASIPAEKLRYYQQLENALPVPLDVAVRDYLRQTGSGFSPTSVAEVVGCFLAEISARKGTRGASDEWVRTVRRRSALFSNRFSDAAIHTVTPEHLRDFIHDPAWAERTRFNVQQIVAMIYRWARENDRLPTGRSTFDLLKPKLPKPLEQEKQVLPPEHLRRMFQACLDSGRRGFIPALAIAAFGGVRSAECRRLRWGVHVDLEARVIRLTNDITKTARRRTIPISDTLYAWLTLDPSAEASLVQPYTDADRILAILWRDVAGLPCWPHNALRVSFVSYAVAETENTAAVANLAGHSETMLQTTYKQIRNVSKKTAADWFSIRPQTLLTPSTD